MTNVGLCLVPVFILKIYSLTGTLLGRWVSIRGEFFVVTEIALPNVLEGTEIARELADL